MKRKALEKLESIAKRDTRPGVGTSSSIMDKKDIKSLPTEIIRKIAIESIRDRGYFGRPDIEAGNDLYEAIFNKRPFKVKRSVQDYYYDNLHPDINYDLFMYGVGLAKKMGIRVRAGGEVYDNNIYPATKTVYLPTISSMANLPRHSFKRFFTTLGDLYISEKFKDQESYRGYNNYSDFLLATKGDNNRKVGFKDGHDWWKNSKTLRREDAEDYLLHYNPEMVNLAFESVYYDSIGVQQPPMQRPRATTWQQVSTASPEHRRIRYELDEEK